MRKEAPKDDGDEVKAEAEEVKPEPEFDIEAEIAAEVKGLRKPTSEPLFTNVKVDVQCGESLPSSLCSRLNEVSIRQPDLRPSSCHTLLPNT